MMVSETDIEEAAMAGAAGVKAVRRRDKKMIAFKRDSDVPYTMHCAAEDVSLICNQRKNSRRNGFPQQETISLMISPLRSPADPGRAKARDGNGVPKYLYRNSFTAPFFLSIKKFV